MDTVLFASDHPFALAGMVAAIIAAVGLIGDTLNTRRRDLDKVSLVSWGKLSTLALIVAIVCGAMALHSPS